MLNRNYDKLQIGDEEKWPRADTNMQDSDFLLQAQRFYNQKTSAKIKESTQIRFWFS